jgi:Kef-type K+ transport system membrane component KefB
MAKAFARLTADRRTGPLRRLGQPPVPGELIIVGILLGPSTRIGGIALASAAIDDVLAWSLLAVVVAIADADSQQSRLLQAAVCAA